MTFYAMDKTKIYIGGVLSMKYTDFIDSDFTGQTWTEIGSTEGLGKIGGDSRVKKLKGSCDSGNMELVCAIDSFDAGQEAIIAAQATKYNYAFKLVFNDAPSGDTPRERKFIALVMSAEEQFDPNGPGGKLYISLALNSNIVGKEEP